MRQLMVLSVGAQLRNVRIEFRQDMPQNLHIALPYIALLYEIFNRNLFKPPQFTFERASSRRCNGIM